MQTIVGQKSFSSAIGQLVIFLLIDFVALFLWGFLWFILGLALTAVLVIPPFNRANKNGITVDDKGVSGKANGVPFHLNYDQITLVEVCSSDDSVQLVVACGVSRYAINIANAVAVRDVIMANLTFLGLNLEPATAQPAQ